MAPSFARPASPTSPVWGRFLAPGLMCVLGLSPACTWVSPTDLTAKLDQVDDDADGYPAAEDCDDGDPKRNPDAVEVWYDGADQDCAGDDDFDADADGFVEVANVGLKTEGVQTSGNLPGGDCNDADFNARPGGADVWYDGADTDCDGRDDFDADVDGYVSTEDAGLPTTNVAGSGALPGGDCDDDESRVNPGAADSWYSGVDEDCANNDDFDQDGDGQVPDEHVGRATLYVPTAGDLPGGDCDDQDLTVFTGATEDFYNGKDDDCDPLTVEFDQDGDGIESDAATAGSPDCDDTDAEVYPGAPELFQDGLDADCDGSDDTFEMGGVEDWSPVLDSVTWTGVGDVRVTATTTTVWFTVSAEEVTLGRLRSEETVYDGVTAFGLSRTAPDAGITEVITLVRNPTDVTGRTAIGPHDVAIDGDRLLVAHALQRDDERILRIAAWDVGDNTRLGTDSRSTTADAPFTDVRLAVDAAGTATAAGCEPTDDQLQTLRASRTDLELAIPTEAVTVNSVDTDLCLLDAHDAVEISVFRTAPGILVEETFLPGSGWSSLTPTDQWPTVQPIDLSSPKSARDRWLVVADDSTDKVVVVAPTGGLTTVSNLSQPIRVQAQVLPGETALANPELLIGWVDSAGTAHIAWGSPGSTFEDYEVPTDFTARSVALWADDAGVVFVAIAGDDDITFGIARR